MAEIKDNYYAETKDKADIANIDISTTEGNIDIINTVKTICDDDNVEDNACKVEEFERQPLVDLKTDTAIDFIDID